MKWVSTINDGNRQVSMNLGKYIVIKMYRVIYILIGRLIYLYYRGYKIKNR